MKTLRRRTVRPLPDRVAEDLGATAVAALLDELETWPKPGMVSHIDAGSHADMDAATFRASAAAIRPFYGELAAAGAAGSPMVALREIGVRAERAMLDATDGVNTHRGAIFGLGLLCAAAGSAWEERRWGAGQLCAIVRQTWGPEIPRGPIPLHSHGAGALRRHGAGGARAEAAHGFPNAVQVGLPALRLGHRLAPGDPEAARVQAFFALLAALEDTNLLHRGGSAGLRFGQDAAARFLAAGGVAEPKWRERAEAVHHAFVAKRLSPGGCADLLAITLFLHAMESGF